MFYRIIAVLAVTAGLVGAAIPTGYVSYWPMDGDLTDAGASNDGTSSDSTGAVFAPGVSGQALELDGSNTVDLGNDASLDFSGAFSIGGWVYLYSRGSYHSLVQKATWNSGFHIRQAGSFPGYWRFDWEDLEYTSDPQDVDEQTNEWVHIMGVYDGAVMYQYRNGQLVDTTASDGMNPTTAALKIGTVNGLVDELIYYDRALSAADVGELMTATRDTTPAVISGIGYETLPAYSAVIRWKTDMLATREVEYGIDTSYFSRLFRDLDTVHAVQINGLVDGTEYRYRVRSMNAQGYLTVSPWCTLSVAPQDPLQQMNIAGSTKERRPVSPDRVWPAQVGDAHVCLWADDKLSAMNLHADDNITWERDWWLSMAQKYDFTFTWCLISSLDGNTPTSFKGTWADWQVALDAGQDIASHSYMHGCPSCVGEYYYGADYEYSEAVSAQMANLNRRPLFLGKPGQTDFENNSEIAKKYSIAYRSGYGTNPAGRIDYRNFKVTQGGTPDTALVKASVAARSLFVALYHQVGNNNNTQAENDSIHAFNESTFAWIKRNYGDDIWWDGLTPIVQYGQSHDTHTLTVDGITDSMISFTLTDSMMDTLFNYPLTVKVRISNDWDTCIAVQNGHTVDADIVMHDGDTYALVKAVPDRGQVVLSTDGKTSEVRGLKAPVRSPQYSEPVYFELNGSAVRVPMSAGVYLKVENGIVRKVMVME